ncbi:MAG: hypothetical protein ACYTX0_38020 [Nostoc sp.]
MPNNIAHATNAQSLADDLGAIALLRERPRSEAVKSANATTPPRQRPIPNAHAG